MSLKRWSQPFIVDHYILGVEPGKVAVCAKLKLVRLCLCNGLLDFSLLEIWECPWPKWWTSINLIYPTVTCFLWAHYALLDPVGWERGDL